MTVTWNRVLLFAAFVLLLLMTLQSAGVAPIGAPWLGWAGLTAFAASFLIP